VPNEEHLAELEARIGASLKRTGENFILLWPLVVAIVWAASHYSNTWLRIGATAALVLMLLVVCIPNIGRVAALNKINFGMFKQLRKQLILADIGALLVVYAAAALWWSLPLPFVAALVAFAIAFINSQAI
jgi:hypothetical protein